MNYRNAVSITMALLLIFGICSMTVGQDNATSGFPIKLMPNIFHQQANALGKRLKTAGQEQTIYVGQLFDKDGKSSPARVVHQLPGLVRLEGFKGQRGAISFDGKKSHGITSRQSDESILEIFTSDFPEGMFASVQNGAAVRLLGRGFGPDPNAVSSYTGPRYDIYEVTAPVPCREDQLTRLKRYYFDTNTGLMQSVRYNESSGSSLVKRETRFSVWGNIDGSAYPARIDHYANGQLVFTFISEAITDQAATNQTIFQ
jgi:hypothetical protein